MGKKEEILDISANLVKGFYGGQVESFLEYFSEDILWVGPISGMFIKGKDKVIKAWAEDPHKILYSVSSIESIYQKTSNHSAQILLLFKVNVCYPDGQVRRDDKRVQMTWIDEKIELDGQFTCVPRIKWITISNGFEGDIRERMYNPLGITVPHPDLIFERINNQIRLEVTDVQKTKHYLIPEAVKYFESWDDGKHSMVHLIDKDLECLEKIADLEQSYSKHLIRIHASYLVNPAYIMSIKRFEIKLVGDIYLPVPEKKYTKVKTQIQDYFRKTS